MVPPCSDRISRVPPYSRIVMLSTDTGLSPSLACLSRQFSFLHYNHWPGPFSLATTNGVSMMSFPPGTEMFQFPGFASCTYVFSTGYHTRWWVSPFGNARIKAYSQLPAPYRSVSRPSSPLRAKASTKCP